MSTHIPSAAYVAIHSVCVSASYRRTGVALSLLKHFVEQVKLSAKVKGCRLITHEELVGLYEKCGFEMVGESAVVHGERKWYEMKIDFPSVPVEVDVKKVEAENVRNPGKTLQSFGGGEVGMAALVNGEGMNKAKLYCPRGECRCLLLNAGVGKWVKQHSSDFLVSSSLNCSPATLDQSYLTPPTVARATTASHVSNSSIVIFFRLLVHTLPSLLREHRFLAKCCSSYSLPIFFLTSSDYCSDSSSHYQVFDLRRL